AVELRCSRENGLLSPLLRQKHFGGRASPLLQRRRGRRPGRFHFRFADGVQDLLGFCERGRNLPPWKRTNFKINLKDGKAKRRKALRIFDQERRTKSRNLRMPPSNGVAGYRKPVARPLRPLM